MPTNVRKINPIDLLPDVAVGIMLPMTGEDGSLFKLSYTTQEQAISNLKNLLLTIKGERPMQPFFGTNIQKMLFEQITEDVFERIEKSVRTAIEYWLPYIILTDLELEGFFGTVNGMEEHGIYLRLLVKITNDGANVPIVIFYTPSTIQAIEQYE
jgi:phage baseplate assembly protein W